MSFLARCRSRLVFKDAGGAQHARQASVSEPLVGGGIVLEVGIPGGQRGLKDEFLKRLILAAVAARTQAPGKNHLIAADGAEAGSIAPVN